MGQGSDPAHGALGGGQGGALGGRPARRRGRGGDAPAAAVQPEHRHRLGQGPGLVTRAAFCWVVSSIWAMAWFTCSMPWLCSVLAALISPMMSVTRFTALTISSMVAPACSTSR
jgi:hypothetical protein